MKAYIPVIAATIFLAVSPGRAADTAFRDFITPAEYQDPYPLNRLDLDDLLRERAREAEHRRIRTRLGDPGRGCQTVAVEGREDDRTLYPGLLVIVCR
jgi:hypothetical protein